MGLTKRPAVKAGMAGLLVLGVLQFYQPKRTNPPFNASTSFEAVAKPSKEVAVVVSRACKNCHSQETEWPWYSNVSPVSWLVARDVEQGRKHLNLSQWDIYAGEMSKIRVIEMCEEAKAGKMPLKPYTFLHPEARLTSADITALCTVNVASR
jgi:hypothetical protein